MALFAATAGRGPLNDALELEESRPHDHGGAAHEDLLGRGAQEVGGALGLLLLGVALGVIFIVVWASVSSRLGARSAIGSTMKLGAVGFVAVVVVPFLKYPANPPAVGDPDTVDQRTVQYLMVVAFSIVLAVLTWQLYRRVAGSVLRRTWVSSIVYAAGLAVVAFVIPASPDDVEAPADLVWQFRLASLGVLAVGWAVLSLVTGTLLTSLERVRVPDDSSEHRSVGQPT